MPGYSTNLLHADINLQRKSNAAPPMNVANLFQYPSDAEQLDTFVKEDQISSHETNPNTSRCEAVLSSILEGHAIVYSNAVSMLEAVLLTTKPKQVFIDSVRSSAKIALQRFQQNEGLELYHLADVDAECDDGDLVYIETPTNPWGTAINLRYWADKVHKKGGKVVVDATTAPPPILEPFKFGADLVVYSGSKYFGGHSDVLCGVIVTRDDKIKHQLIQERIKYGSILSTFNSWLLLRSLRTLSLRVKQQIQNAEEIVQYLVHHIDELPKLVEVHHISLQTEKFVAEQYPNGGSPAFSIELIDAATAKQVSEDLQLFACAASVGGVQSSCKWQLRSSTKMSQELVQISVGIEDVADLIEDLAQALA